MYLNEKVEIKKKLLSVLKNSLNKSTNELVNNFNCSNLLDEPLNLQARDLLFLLLKCEEEFRIKIDEKDLKKYSFNTLDNICLLIYQKQLAYTKKLNFRF